MSYYGNMKGSDFWSVAQAYVQKKYGKDTKVDLSITTKGNKKLPYSDPNYDNRYTMFAYKDDVTLAQSAQVVGSHKDRWSAEELVEFLTSLERV